MIKMKPEPKNLWFHVFYCCEIWVFSFRLSLKAESYFLLGIFNIVRKTFFFCTSWWLFEIGFFFSSCWARKSKVRKSLKCIIMWEKEKVISIFFLLKPNPNSNPFVSRGNGLRVSTNLVDDCWVRRTVSRSFVM